MNEWQKRVIEESNELLEKISKLNSYLNNPQNFENGESKLLLKDQKSFMIDYSILLLKRIKGFSSKIEKRISEVSESDGVSKPSIPLTKYISSKIVNAKPMNRASYNDYRGWKVPSDEDPEDDGYLVVYPDGHKSWCPKKQFEDCNRPCDGMTFGHAIEALRKGLKIARKSWNEKGMFVFKQVPSEVSKDIVPRMTSLPDSVKEEFIKRDQGPSYMNQIAIVKSDGTVDSWIASSSDTFADDWEIIE